jgi:murein DD-endopeptidase MepM/ murein hydrolase activator NlpD
MPLPETQVSNQTKTYDPTRAKTALAGWYSKAKASSLPQAGRSAAGQSAPQAESIQSQAQPSAAPKTSRIGDMLKGWYQGARKVGTQTSKPTVTNTKSSAASPVFSTLGAITTPYGGSTKYEKFHPGIDIANKRGTEIPSYADGEVVESVTGQVQSGKGYGNYVLIKSADGSLWKYSHMSKNYYPVGTKVTKGQNIGQIGNSGASYSLNGNSGDHLDVRVVNKFNQYVDPSSLVS